MKKAYIIQSVLLLIGTVFAWSTVYSDFARFYSLYGDITRIKGCVIPNPVTTPCFYGAFAFLGAFIWSIYILRAKKARRDINQSRLHMLLIASTIFAWSNLSHEIYNFYFKNASQQISCSGVPTTSIFTTPCFIGSMIFLGTLVISYIIKSTKKIR